jgi:anaerobic selenocysteine-containing dehydrogenase
VRSVELLEAPRRTICRSCHGGCGVLVDVADGRLAGLRGDPENPNNRGFLCAKGQAALELLQAPDRLTGPLRRVGPRGSGEFEPCGWDEALDRVASRVRALTREHGAESLALAQGTDRNYQEWVFRLAHALGTPNVLGPAHVCFYPKAMAAIFTLGDMVFADYESTPECLLLWGSDKPACNSDGVIGVRLREALRRGTQLIVIDPRRTPLAKRARHFLQVRPGSDAALALAFLNVVIEERLYDLDFVRDFTLGFDELRAHVRPFTPEWAAPLTWVAAEAIRAAARAYAQARSAALELGTGVEQNRNGFHCARAAYLLSALCGNLDRPGGDAVWEPSGVVGRREFPASELLGEEQKRKRVGGSTFRLLSAAGWVAPGALWDALQARRVRGLLVFGSNLLVAYADSERVRRALETLDLLVVSDLFLTPTARLADVVLPVSSWLERDQVVEFNSFLAARTAQARVGECRSDEEIILALAARLGLQASFWPDLRAALDYKLRPLGLDWETFVARHYVALRHVPFKYRERGFRTRSGKVNLSAAGLRAMGYEPLPVFRPVEDHAEGEGGGYVLTSHHSPYYFNSEFRSLAGLRRREPDPCVELHPAALAREGLKDGDWVRVEAHGSAARFRARRCAGLDPRVACVSASWWYPEIAGDESWRRSNLNLLTREEGAGEELGSSNLRGLACRLRKEA